jgi:cytochrome c biogenesis protein CcdA
MLVGLGAQVIYNFQKKKVHQHGHGHVESEHHHFHSHAQSLGHAREHHQLRGVGKPFLRKKSFIIGMFQGVAGTAAVTLLVLASIESPVAGAVYLLLFGLGSVLSMGLMTILIGLPFVYSTNRLPNLNRVIQFGVGALSIVFGIGLMYEVGFVEGLF